MRTMPVRENLTEIGRIRIGNSSPIVKNGKEYKRPQRLDTFRLTSQDRTSIERAAALYGGEMKEWKGGGGILQWEVVTQANSLRVIVQGHASIAGAYEAWDGETLLRRCDGAHILRDAQAPSLVGSECQCSDQAPGICKIVIRMSCTLPDIAQYGVWRIDSHGINATAELLGVKKNLEARGIPPSHPFEAYLRLETRRSGGKTIRVPVLALAHEAFSYTPPPVPTRAQRDAAIDELFGASPATDHLARIRQAEEAEAAQRLAAEEDAKRQALLGRIISCRRRLAEGRDEETVKALYKECVGTPWSELSLLPLEELEGKVQAFEDASLVCSPATEEPASLAEEF